MTSQPGGSDSQRQRIPEVVLQGAAKDDQLKAAARSWHSLPQLTRERMLERAERLGARESTSNSDDTRPASRKDTSTQLPRPQAGPLRADEASSSASMRRRQVPVPNESGGSSRRSARRSAIQPLPPGPARRKALFRLGFSLALFGIVAGVGYWFTLQPQVIPDSLFGRADFLVRSAARGWSGNIRKISVPGTESNAVKFGRELRRLLPAQYRDTELVPWEIRVLSDGNTSGDYTRLRLTFPVDQTAQPDLPSRLSITLFWQEAPDRGWLLLGSDAESVLTRALTTARHDSAEAEQ